MLNFGPLMAEIGSGFLDTPANFNGFRILALLLQRRRSTEVNQTLHDVWPSPALLHYIYFFRAVAPDGILPGAKFTLRPSLAFSYIGSVTARQSSSGPRPNFAAWYKEWNYGTFAKGATYIRLGGHHVGHLPTFLYLFTFAINLWNQKFVTADVTAVFVNNQRRGIQRRGQDFDKSFVFKRVHSKEVVRRIS